MKKAFTLVELLAVIIVLAVIALIATPIVVKVVEKAKKETFYNSVHGLVRTLELKSMEELLDGNSVYKQYFFPTDEIDVNGTQPNGTATVDSQRRIKIAVHNEKWCATKDYFENEITIKNMMVVVISL